MKHIKVHIDSTSPNVNYMSYEDVRLARKDSIKEVIITHCTNFFKFESLDMGYDVIVYNHMGDNVILSELLDKDKCKKYTDKEIRRSHNTEKLLLAGAFKFISQ